MRYDVYGFGGVARVVAVRRGESADSVQRCVSEQCAWRWYVSQVRLLGMPTDAWYGGSTKTLFAVAM